MHQLTPRLSLSGLQKAFLSTHYTARSESDNIGLHGVIHTLYIARKEKRYGKDGTAVRKVADEIVSDYTV